MELFDLFVFRCGSASMISMAVFIALRFLGNQRNAAVWGLNCWTTVSAEKSELENESVQRGHHRASAEPRIPSSAHHRKMDFPFRWWHVPS